METIKLNVTVDHKRFYNPESMWGVFGLIPNTNKDKIETLDWRGIFAVSGNTPDLTIGEDYDIEITPSYNKKYGKGYEFVMVAAKRPETVNEQQDYLRMMVTDKQFDEIIKVYPNEKILDLMENGEFDYEKVHGFGKITYERVKKILFDNLEIQEALVALKDMEISVHSIKKLISHFDSARAVVDIAENDIYKFCEVEGFGFKTVDNYALNRGDDPTSKSRINAGLVYTLEQDASKGHSWMSVDDLIKEGHKLLEIEKEYIEDFVEKLESKQIYKDSDRIALKKNYDYETKFMERIEKMLGSPVHTKVDNVNEVISKLEKENGFKYTSEQRDAIKKSVENNVMVINGKAGTGKSTILKGVIDTLSDYTYMSCSLSGKAVKVLRSNGLRAKTIHKMLAEREIDERSGEPIPISYDIVIIDEASMVNNYLFYEVATSLKKNAKLIIVGDNGQLPAIGTGANFDNLIRYGDIPRQELTIVHRQAQKSGILSIANEIRDGKQINAYDSYEIEIYGELQDMTLVPTNKETDIKQMVIDIAERNKGTDLYEFQVISGRVDSGEISVKNLNIELQKVFNNIRKPHVTRGGYDYREGDKIIQNGNNYEALSINGLGEQNYTEVFNGTLGIIEKIEFDSDTKRRQHVVYIRFEDYDDLIIYNMDEMAQISLAYALTVHKMQGSQVDKLVFAFDGASFMLLCREFIYTGITRAKEGCIMICENDMLHMGIRKSQGDNRRTFLRGLLEK